MKAKNILYSLFLGLLILNVSCKKFADVDAPANQLSSGTVFTNNTTLKSAIAGMYSTFIVTNSTYMQTGLTTFPAMSADELLYNGADYDGFSKNALVATDSYVQGLWSAFYKNIYLANSIIEGLQQDVAAGITDSLKVDAIAESKFVRAFNHFYLVNLWGDVPIVTTTNSTTNEQAARSNKDSVYKQIISDLTDAKNALKTDYSYSSGERIRPNKFAAAALLARAYLYTGDWENAAANAEIVIDYTTYYSLLTTANLGAIFTKNNTEAIWQMAPSLTVGYTSEGNLMVPASTSVPYFWIDSTKLLKAFETGDMRYTNWVGKQTIGNTNYYYPYKYKLKTTNSTASAEYVTYLRLAEQYLIRAEARAELNNLSGAIADINVIRNRAGLANTTATSQAAILLAIEQERRVELFSEYGHRWMDLKRTNRVDAVLGASKASWVSTGALYPIPQTDRSNDVNLTQNPGY